MSFCLSFHLALLGPTGAHWLDNASDLSCMEDTGQHAMDGPRLSPKQPSCSLLGRPPWVKIGLVAR